MSIYFVRKTGNDETGDGSTGNPWLTLTYALTQISTITGPHTLKVGTGTYSEAGNFTISGAYASVFTIESETGANDVNINGNDTNNVIVSGSRIVFRNLTFNQVDASKVNALRLSTGANIIRFVSCVFTLADNEINTSPAVYAYCTALTISNIIFFDCQIIALGEYDPSACGFSFATGAIDPSDPGRQSDIQLIDCAVEDVSRGVVINGNITTLEIRGGSYLSDRGGVIIGEDGVSNTKTIDGVTIGHAIISSTINNYGILVGAGAKNVLIEKCSITGVLMAVHIKEHSGTIIKECTLVAGSESCVKCEAVNEAIIKNNRLLGVNHTLGLVYVVAGVTANKCGAIQLKFNYLVSTGTGVLLNWGNSDHDSGESVCNDNLYDPEDLIGNVYGTASIINLPDLHTAWSTYSVTNNDSRSRVYYG